MSLKKLFLDRYLSNEKMREGYYLRIRKNKKDTEENIKVYYEGFKIFDLIIKKTKNDDREELNVNPQIFIPNSKNVYKNKEFISCYKDIPNNVLKDFQVIDKYFDIFIGSKKKGCQNPYYKLDFKFAEAAKNVESSKLSSMIDKYFDIDIKDNIVLGKDTIYFALKNRTINFYQLYDLRIKLLEAVLYGLTSNDGNRYFQSVDLGLKFELNKEINELDLGLIENTVVNRTKIYAGLDIKKIDRVNILIDKFLENKDELTKDEINEIDYINTKSPTNQEKQKQQAFMVELNKNNRDDIKYITKDGDIKILYPKEVEPFELEYVIYAGKEIDKLDDKDFLDDELDLENEKIGRGNIKGRIDNTLVNRNEAVFVEIKYGNEVIDKSNGIHKHLIDLYSCLSMNKDGILKDYYHRVKERYEIIGRKKEKFIINKIRYDIVCIYNDKDILNKDKLSFKAVKSKIDDIYNKSCYEGMKIDEDSNKIKVCNNHNNELICKDANKYCKNLLNKNIPKLINMINELGCCVKIILVDDEFKEFSEYIYDIEN